MPRSYGNKVYVSNIDFNCSIQDLREAFQEGIYIHIVSLFEKYIWK